MNSKTFKVFNPNDGSVIRELEIMGYNETLAAIASANEEYKNWKNTSPQERARIVESWYELLTQNREEIAKIVNQETGKPFKEALGEVDYANSFVKYYSQEILRLQGEISTSFRKNQWSVNLYEPIGIVGAITPWNFPAAMITKKIAPALVAGCPVVLKPSEETPLSAIKIRQLAIKAGIPEKAFAIVYGDAPEIGRAMLDSSHIKMISFTGSVKVGKYLMEKSASTVKKLVLELGGNAPAIIMPDADLELSAKKIASGKFRNAGQACTSPNRIFVHKLVQEKFLNILINEIADNKYEIGPLINISGKNKAEELVNEAVKCGAEIIFKAKIPDNQKSASYLAPLIIAKVSDEMRIAKEEIFAPIFSILSFTENEELIERANNTSYGLAAYLFSKDLKSSLDVSHKLNFGVIGINETIVGNEYTIHGGFNESGLGREGGKPGLMEYFESKFIIF